MHTHDRWRSRAGWWRLAMVVAGVGGAMLAGACGSLANVPTTAGAAANQIDATLAAQMTAFGPTFAAETTRLMQEGTALAPQYEASQTAVILTVDAAALPGSPTDTPLPPSGGSAPTASPTATPPPPAVRRRQRAAGIHRRRRERHHANPADWHRADADRDHQRRVRRAQLAVPRPERTDRHD